ncbi:MAG: hypothetical protein ACJAZ3_001896, partial [Sphingobacteriales bacterium]
MKKLYIQLLFVSISLLFANVTLAQTNDNILGAIDLTVQLNKVDSDTRFECAKYYYSPVGSTPTRQNVTGGDAVSCDWNSNIYKDVWFKYTVDANTPNTWISAYQVVSSTNAFVLGVYSGIPTVTGNTINGLTYIDCSYQYFTDDILLPARTPRDVAVNTIPVPRLDLSNLPIGTYYIRLWSWDEPAATEQFNICLEHAGAVDIASDRCPTETIPVNCGNLPNLNVDKLFKYQSNAGVLGNANNNQPNEPQVSPYPTTDIAEGCGAFITTISIGGVNNIMNNTAIYALDMNSCGTCLGTFELTLENIVSDGFPLDPINGSGAIQISVFNEPCASGTNSIMGAGTFGQCIKMRPAGNAPLPNGRYYILVDGQNGQLLQYDMRIKINYDGAGCVKGIKPIADFTVVEDTFCYEGSAVQSTITFTGKNGGDDGICYTPSYNWSFGGGTIVSGTDVGPYEVSWNTVGSKKVSLAVTNAGCTSPLGSSNVLISPLPISTFDIQAEACVGAAVLVTYTGGAPASAVLNFDFKGGTATPVSATQFSVVWNSDGPRNVTLTVTDKGCISEETSKPIDIIAAPSVTLEGTDLACFNDNSGSIDVVSSGAGTPFTFKIGTGSYAATSTFTGLAAGDYTISVKNNIGCVTIENVTLSEPPSVAFTPEVVNTLCGESNGSIEVTNPEGTPDFTYQIDGGGYSGTALFSNLAANSYSISVKDDNGCFKTSSVVVSNTDGPTITLQTNNPDSVICFGDLIDSIHVTATDGTAGYTFGIENIDSNANGKFFNLPAGNYVVEVIDGAGCSAFTDLVEIRQAPIVAVSNIEIENAHCSKFDGSVEIFGQGGVAPLQYSLDNGTPQASGLFSGLDSGAYKLTVIDAKGCIKDTIISIADLGFPTAVITESAPEICFGESLTLNGTNLVPTSIYSWTPDSVLDLVTSFTVNATPIEDTKFFMTVTDQFGCMSVDSTTIIVNPIPDVDAGDDQKVCPGETAQLNATGGTVYKWNADPSLSDINIANPVASPNGTTNYSVFVTDENNCSNFDEVLVTVLPLPVINTSDTILTCPNVPVQIGASGAATYKWSPAAGLSNANIANPVATAREITNYTVIGTDTNGCSNTSDLVVDMKDVAIASAKFREFADKR